jgi:hypothetical protein
MTEQQWLTCTMPDDLLNWLEDRVSDRKLRLFATACCRHVWKLIAHPDAREAVQISERFADGLATAKELAAAKTKALRACRELAKSMRTLTEQRKFALASRQFAALAAASCACEADVISAAFRTKMVMAETRGRKANREELEDAYQCELLRDLFGNPFRRSKWQAKWGTPAVVELATVIYEQRRFERMPRLGGLLQKAGCESTEVLQHCRSSVEHVRGCWVVDLVLGQDAKVKMRR